jgi:hypothetical protein
MLEDAAMAEISRQVPQASKVPKRERDTDSNTSAGQTGTRRPRLRPPSKDRGREDGDGYVPV